MKIRLSYTLSKNTPLYPGTLPLKIESVRSMARGDSANTSEIRFSSHIGTHIDVPNHFCKTGSSVTGCLTEENHVFPVFLFNLPNKVSNITVADIPRELYKHPEARGILFRTGVAKQRASHPECYLSEYPFIDDAVPDFLRQWCPDIKIFGIDTISISHPKHKDIGRSCHRNFLCKIPPILILEDLDLSHPALGTNPFTISVYPWVYDDLDGTPVMVFADIT